MFVSQFPSRRLRRNRVSTAARALVQETTLTPSDLIYPLFVHEEQEAEAVPSMPGVFRYGETELVKIAKAAQKEGIQALALFPKVSESKKTRTCEEAWNPDNLVCRTVKRVKDACPELDIICDVALDPYNSDGHDGLVENGKILNDPTLELLAQQALVQSQAGCTINAPSDMMDGRIGYIRKALDHAGEEECRLMAYSAKYASAFYGPFRDAVGSGSALKGDKKTYQMNPANSNEALHETALDIQEGADLVMVKPGLPYLDILYRVKETFKMPTCVYQVSGEYSMLAQACEQGWFDREQVVLESLIAFKRAGADAILTYFALEAARILQR